MSMRPGRVVLHDDHDVCGPCLLVGRWIGRHPSGRGRHRSCGLKARVGVGLDQLGSIAQVWSLECVAGEWASSWML